MPAPTREQILAAKARARELRAPLAARPPSPSPCKACSTISIIIPAIDEDPKDLAQTLATIKAGTLPPYEIILIDDHSRVPIPNATLRNPVRLGATRSRRLGCELATGKFIAILDSHMKIAPNALRQLSKIAAQTHGIAYAACSGHKGAKIVVRDGILEAIWIPSTELPKQPLIQTSSLMGACYVVERRILEGLGGWIGLPGPLGSQELSMSILATKCKVPLTLNPSIDNWHKFRKQPTAPFPYGRFSLNRAVTYRLLFSDETWAKFRAILGSKTSGHRIQIPEAILKEAESPQFLHYGAELRAGMIMSDDEFLAPYREKLGW